MWSTELVSESPRTAQAPGPHLPALVGSPVVGVMFGDVGVDAT